MWNYSWDQIEEKSEKKRMLKGLVYLDALITLYRMPNQFEFSMSELSERFRGVPEKPLGDMLQKFCKIAVQEKGGPDAPRFKKPSNLQAGGVSFKFMKGKEDAK